MKNAIVLFFFLSTLFLCFSCKYQADKVEPILQKVETLLEQHPDSALVLLEEIPNPQSLKKSLYYQYFLLQIQAKDKSYRDITSDTLIFDIQKYYKKENDIEKAALASFYSGRIRQEQKQYEEALKIYLDAGKYLNQSYDNNLKGLVESSVGAVYYEQLLTDKAIIHLKKAEKFFYTAENHRNEIITGNLIGNCFLMEEETDSAFSYYFKALASADSLGFEQEQVAILESLGVACRETGDWPNAEKFLKETLYLTTDSIEKSRVLSNFAELFFQIGKLDSASHYIMQSLVFLPAEKDNYLAANIYETWSAIYEKSENFKDALEKYKIYSDYLVLIFEENRDKDVMEVEKKYNFQLIVTQNKQLIIERQRILLFSILLLLFFIVLSFILYHYHKQNKRKLKETEQKVRKLNELARSFNEKENSLRNILVRHFDILKKAALLEGYLKEDEKRKGKLLLQKFNEVVYGEKSFNWDLLYETLNSLSNNFFNRLSNKFPQLDESEFRICCLLAVDFSNTEIAIILNYSINTVQAKRSVIRKKLGIKPFGNIRDFLNAA
nr:hypothetical protein [uncultured Draconibacterium sp.]